MFVADCVSFVVSVGSFSLVIWCCALFEIGRLSCALLVVCCVLCDLLCLLQCFVACYVRWSLFVGCCVLCVVCLSLRMFVVWCSVGGVWRLWYDVLCVVCGLSVCCVLIIARGSLCLVRCMLFDRVSLLVVRCSLLVVV